MSPQILFALLLLFMAAACSPPPRKASVPQPPPIQPETAKPRHVTPGPKDRLVRNCTVTKERKDSVDCVCLRVSTRIDSVTGETSMDCRTSPERKQAK